MKKYHDATFPDNTLAGFVQTLHLLRDDRVQEFVANVREREGLEYATDREMLQQNLEARCPEDFVDEALPVAMDYWLRQFTDEGEEYEAPVEWRTLTEALGLQDQAKAAQAMLAFFGRGIGYHAKRSAGVVSRFIVMGAMEVPASSGTAGSVVTRLPLGDGEDAILAIATRYTDVAALVRRLRSLHSELFTRGERNRLPAKAHETVWLRFCADVAGHGPEVEAGKYRYLAELYFELHPKERPRGGPLSSDYEGAVEKHAWRIRKNCEYWAKRLKAHLAGEGENGLLTSPLSD